MGVITISFVPKLYEDNRNFKINTIIIVLKSVNDSNPVTYVDFEGSFFPFFPESF